MTVEYVADELEGFVPRISWEDNVNPFKSERDNELTPF